MILFIQIQVLIVSGAIAAKILELSHVWHFLEFGNEDYGLRYDISEPLSQWLTKKLSTLFLTNSLAVKEKYSKFIPAQKIKTIYEAYEDCHKIKINLA